MNNDGAGDRSTPAATNKPQHKALSLFVVLVCLHAAGAFDAIIEFLFPGQMKTTIQTAGLVLWLSLYAYSLVVLFRDYGSQWLIDLVRTRWLLLIVVLIALLSPLWSLDAPLSAQRVVHLVGTTLLGVFIGYHFEVSKIFRSLFLVICILIFGGALAAVFLPSLGQAEYEGELTWRGLQTEKNSFGFLASILVILALCRVQSVSWSQSRLTCAFVVLVAVVSLVMSKSMTSVVALIFALVVMASHLLAFRMRLPTPMTFAFAFAVALLAVVAAGVSGFDRSDEWTALVGRSADLTGRTDIWSPAWRLVLDHPMLGYGYGALWFPRFGLEGTQQGLLGLTFTAYSAHNGFLQLASEIGLPAAIIAVLFALLSLSEMIRLASRRPSPYILFVIAFQAAFLLANVSEAMLFIDRNLFWMLFIALPLSASRSYQRLSLQEPRTNSGAVLSTS